MAAPGIHTALIGAVIGYALGHWLGNYMTPSFVATGGGAPDGNDTAIVLGYAFLILGWLIGLGVFNDLVRQMLGRPLNRNIAAFEGHETPTAASPGTSGSPSTTRSSACST